MYEVSDEQGNSCFVESHKLAMKIVKDVHNPFINIVKLNDKVKVLKQHLIKTEDEFYEYFY